MHRKLYWLVNRGWGCWRNPAGREQTITLQNNDQALEFQPCSQNVCMCCWICSLLKDRKRCHVNIPLTVFSALQPTVPLQHLMKEATAYKSSCSFNQIISVHLNVQLISWVPCTHSCTPTPTIVQVAAASETDSAKLYISIQKYIPLSSNGRTPKYGFPKLQPANL